MQAKEEKLKSKMEGKLKRLSYFVIDTETSMNAAKFPLAEMIEITILQVLPNDALQKVYSKQFMPANDITPEATAVHGLTKELLTGCQRFSPTDAKEISEVFVNSLGIVGHNVDYDIGIIRKEFMRMHCERLLERLPPLICTLKLAINEDHLPA